MLFWGLLLFTVIDLFLSPVQNPCGVGRGGCEHICVLSHQSDNGGLGYRCKCRMGYDLHADGKRCFGKTISIITVMISALPRSLHFP